MSMIIGLDVHSKATVYCAQEETGGIIGEDAVATTAAGLAEMVTRLGAPQGTRIGLETGTQATFVARCLSALGMAPRVIDAHEVRAKARRPKQKSDRRDAFEICDGLRRGIFTSEVYVPDERIQRLRCLLSRRRHFVRVSTGQVNAAKFVLRSAGLRDQVRSLTTAKAWEDLLANPAVRSLRPFLELHGRIWQAARQCVAALEAELDAALRPYQATVELLRTAPSVGPICAATFLATLGDVTRFPDSGHVGSYLGLTPSTYDSGEAVRHGHIVKTGSPELRAVLCEVAHHAARADHPLNPYWRKFMAKGGLGKAVVAVAHRLARILYQMWRQGERFDVTKLNVVCERVVRTKTYNYRLREEATTTAH